MMEKFRNKYRIESSRLHNWDYGSPGLYFITICTRNRECYFGEIVGKRTIIDRGDSVETQCIASLPKPIASLPKPIAPQRERIASQPISNALRPQPQMQLSELGIIVETEWLKTPEIRPDMNLTMGEFKVMPNHFHAIVMIGENVYNTGIHGDENNGIKSINKARENNANKFGPQSKNLGSIIRGFKSSVTTCARKLNIDFAWQARFHDHIIRNHNEFIKISHYIANNPANWKDDTFFIE